jgi:thymidylate kinase
LDTVSDWVVSLCDFFPSLSPLDALYLPIPFANALQRAKGRLEKKKSDAQKSAEAIQKIGQGKI